MKKSYLPIIGFVLSVSFQVAIQASKWIETPLISIPAWILMGFCVIWWLGIHFAEHLPRISIRWYPKQRTEDMTIEKFGRPWPELLIHFAGYGTHGIYLDVTERIRCLIVANKVHQKLVDQLFVIDPVSGQPKHLWVVYSHELTRCGLVRFEQDEFIVLPPKEEAGNSKKEIANLTAKVDDIQKQIAKQKAEANKEALLKSIVEMLVKTPY